MSKKIVFAEYKKVVMPEGLNASKRVTWIRASDQAAAAGWFSAGDNRFRLEVTYSDGTISVYRHYENVPYDIIKIAEDVAFASEENEKIRKEKMMTDRQLKDICDAYIRGAEKARNNETRITGYVRKQISNDFSPSIIQAFNSLTYDQKNLFYVIVGKALDEAEKERLSNPLDIKKVIFNGPVTIVIWADGSKTVVKLMEGDNYDPEKAIMMCLIEKMLGSKADVKRFFKKWIPEVDLSELGESIGTIASELGKSIGKMVKSVAKALENSVSETEENKKGPDQLELLETKKEKDQ